VLPAAPRTVERSDASCDLLVLGAGPTGLSAAWRAARRGLRVVVLDQDDRTGGVAGSFDVAGVSVDYGSHRLHPSVPPDILAELRGLLGDDLQTRTRHGRLRVGDRWVRFPLNALDLAATLPPTMLAAIARDAAGGPLRRAREDSYAAVLRAGLGPTVYEAVYAPYAEKLWGLPGERIAAEQARRRVSADTPWKVAARIARWRGGGGNHTFYYPRRGFGQIAEALTDHAVAAGAQIRLGAEVEMLAPAYGSVAVATRDGTSITARHAFSTLPLPTLARITHPGPSLAATEAATRLHFRAMVLVYVVHLGGRWTPYDAHYFPGADTPVSRLSEPANYRDGAEDPPDRSVLCAEIPCTIGDDTWNAGEEELAAIVDTTLARTQLPPVRRGDVVVRRLERVYPVYEIGYEQDLAAIDAWMSSLPSVTSFGRLGLFVHDNTHHALIMARDAVAALDDGGVMNPTAWAAARQRFTEHVVDD
jgi:protoporphyrinogen oxidase